jgi:indoleamine 2,3-dioxygenase
VLSYASHALQNWRRFDVTEPVALGNIARLTNFLGGMDEDWFVLVHVAIEGAAGRGLASAMNMSSAVAARDESMVEEYLADIGDALERMIGILRRMPEKCDPYVYYLRVRQFIFGWTEIPGGVTYEGVSAFSGPQSFRGETGAQSAIIPAFDTVLEIGFGSDDELARHQVELTSYMPPAHRATLQSLRNSGVRDFTVGSHRLSLRQTYNRAIRLSANFREHHGGFARAYIAKQTQTSAANPTATGTGGTPFMTYLEQHVRQVQAHEIPV